MKKVGRKILFFCASGRSSTVLCSHALHRSCPGIWAGMKTVKYFEGKTYTWVGISKQPTLSGKVSSRCTLGQGVLILCLGPDSCKQLRLRLATRFLRRIRSSSPPVLIANGSPRPTLQVKRSLSQFTPASWDKDTIDPLSGPKQFVLSTLLVLVISSRAGLGVFSLDRRGVVSPSFV